MKKFLPLLLVFSLATGASGAWAKNSSFGSSFGSSGFRSLQQLNAGPRALSSSEVMTAQQPVPTYRTWSPPLFFWVPMGAAGPMPGGGVGWILVLVLVGVVVLIVFMRRRVPAEGDPDDEDQEELEMLYQRCRKNLDHLASTYVDAQTWLERLKGKIPAAQWKDWNDKYTRISIDDFTKQLKEIRENLDQSRYVTARAQLFSFDEDAVEVFEFFREMENTLEDVG
jgi:hypothetical protein